MKDEVRWDRWQSNTIITISCGAHMSSATPSSSLGAHSYSGYSRYPAVPAGQLLLAPARHSRWPASAPTTRLRSRRPSSTHALHRRTRWPPPASASPLPGRGLRLHRGRLCASRLTRHSTTTLPSWRCTATRTAPSIAWLPKKLVSYGQSWLNPSESKLPCVEVNPI
jgi:hypothetical protein